MKVINLFAGPGAGKSTIAAGVFSKMKKLGLNVELVTEYAKDLTWEGRQNLLNYDQLYVFAKQQRRLDRLRNVVDYVVTDSPLLLGLAYLRKDYPASLGGLIYDYWNRYNNINFFLSREDKVYNPIGRNQTEEEARKLDDKIYSILATNQNFDTISYNKNPEEYIIHKVLNS